VTELEALETVVVVVVVVVVEEAVELDAAAD